MMEQREFYSPMCDQYRANEYYVLKDIYRMPVYDLFTPQLKERIGLLGLEMTRASIIHRSAL